MTKMRIKSCVNSPYSAGSDVQRIDIISSSAAAWSQSQLSTLKHIQTLPSAAANQQSVTQCKLYKVLRVIKHNLTAEEAFLLLSHISRSYAIIKWGKWCAAAGSGVLTAPITSSRKRIQMQTQLLELYVYVIQKSMNRLTVWQRRRTNVCRLRQVGRYRGGHTWQSHGYIIILLYYSSDLNWNSLV